MTVITHVSAYEIDGLQPIFAKFQPDGSWASPEWLHAWFDRVSREEDARRKWPFAHEVVPRQVEKAELIERQYAHLPPKVKW